MEDARIPSIEQLMAEMGWVRKLARALVKNDALADDVAQEAWIIAAKEQPDVDRPLRPWLSRVVSNLVRTRRRSEERRELRDAAVDDDRAVPTPAELMERVELQRAVADELLALGEPYRSTVLLHFIEGYSSAEIARRLGIPDGTVRRRLKVGIDQLRERLRKRTDQPARGWLAALVPLARGLGPAPMPAPTGIAVAKKIGIALVLVLVVIAAVVWRSHGKDHDVPKPSAPRTLFVYGPPKAVAPSSSRTIPTWLTQSGAPNRRIAGRVVFRGIPISGAKVQLGLVVHGESMPTLVMPDSMSRLLQPVAEVTSAADGTFDFGMQPPALFTVSAAAQNFAGVAVSVSNFNPRTTPDQLVLSLVHCGSRLSGTIADASGGAIAKAHILAAGLAGAESDAAGKYSVCLSPRHQYGPPAAQVRVEADGYGAVRREIIVAGDIRVDFNLAPEAVVVGRVTTSDGTPAEGARVIAAAAPGAFRGASGWTISDHEGRFRIGDLAPGPFDVIVRAQGVTAAPVSVVARAAGTSTDVNIVLAPLAEGPQAQVRGHVFMNGTPVVGASIAAIHDGQASRGTTSGTTSQADGSFLLDGVPFGKTRLLVTPYVVEGSNEIDINRAAVDGVRLDVGKVATIRGRVTRHGVPVAGADVLYEPAPQTTLHSPPPTATSNANGDFVMEAVPPGPGRLVAIDYPSKAFTEWVPINLGPAEDKSMDLELACAGEVKGSVVDEAGNAAGGAYVRIEFPGDFCEAMTDAKGQFDCALLSGGVYQPTVSPLPGGRQGFAPARGDHFEPLHVPRDGVVTVTLAVKHERVAIRGSVVDDHGTPMPDVYVEAVGRGDSSMDPPSTMTNTDGGFAIADLARGVYTLRTHAADGSETEVRDVAAGSEPITIKLVRGGTIAGTLVGFSKIPDVFALQNILNGKPARARVDGARFVVAGLAPGRYSIRAQSGAEVDAATVEVRSGETTTVTLRDRGAGTVEGTVTDFATHAPVAGLRCDAMAMTSGQTLMLPPDVTQQAFTDASGHYSVSAPIGRVRIFCAALDGEPRSAAGGDVEVARTGVAKLDVASVRGTFGNAPADAGFMIAPVQLPITVGDVLPNGPAAAAGLRVGDQVLAVDDVPVQGLLPDGAMFLVANHSPGSSMTLRISRGGAVQTIKILVGTPPN